MYLNENRIIKPEENTMALNDFLPGPDGVWPSRILTKANKMKEMTNDICHVFNLVSTEYVIQDYYCSIETSDMHCVGRLYITPNYICFKGSWNNIVNSYPFRSISEITYDTASLLTNSIYLHFRNGGVIKLHFLMQCNEAFAVLKHIWRFPVHYMVFNNSEINDPGKKNLYVNTESARNAHTLTIQGIEQGTEILSELQRQSDCIQQIDSTANRIHNNLDLSNRLIRAIESGPFVNLLTPKSVDQLPFNTPPKLSPKKEIIQIDILLKTNSNDLVEAYLCFDDNTFFVQRLDEKVIWCYQTVHSIVMRARPLHLDVHFRDNSSRFRMLTSHIQIVTNELVLRCGNPTVLFEPNARSFLYGNESLRITKHGSQISTADILSDRVSDKTKYQVQQAEEHLKTVCALVHDLEQIADQMGQTIMGQTQQLDSTSDKIDCAKQKVEKQIHTVQRINRNL